MTDEDTIPFLPFHAINEFMREDYRLSVIRSVLLSLPTPPSQSREALDQLTRRLVQVPGFRNSAKAPVAKRIKPTADAFTKSPYLAAAVLSLWADAHLDLRTRVFSLLAERGWDLLPAESDRTQMPGFYPSWPSGEDFDVLISAYREKYPENTDESDDISLMVVWLSLRIPYTSEDEEEDFEEDNLSEIQE